MWVRGKVRSRAGGRSCEESVSEVGCGRERFIKEGGEVGAQLIGM